MVTLLHYQILIHLMWPPPFQTIPFLIAFALIFSANVIWTVIPGKQSLSSDPWDTHAESELGSLPIYIFSPPLIHITGNCFLKYCIWYKGVTQRLGMNSWCLSKRCIVWSTGYHYLWFNLLCLSPNMILPMACTRHRSLSAAARAKFRFGIADSPSLEPCPRYMMEWKPS